MQKSPNYTIKFISIDEVTTSVAPSQTPSGRLCGLHHHDARKWRDFFMQYEPFYGQCTGAAQRLVAALNDIRYADLQGLPTRRQLYAQHRALSRALMDSELHNLRKRSTATMGRLQELAKSINHNSSNSSYNSLKTTTASCSGGGSYYGSSGTYNRNKIIMGSSGSSSYSFNYQSNQNTSQISHNISTATKSSSSTASTLLSSSATATTLQSQITATNSIIKSSIYSPNNSQTSTTASRVSANYTSNNNSTNNNNNVPATNNNNIDVAIRLQKVTLLFNEIDRAAKRLEQLTEQRREHLRELTRQRALEDEINEVSQWSSSLLQF